MHSCFRFDESVSDSCRDRDGCRAVDLGFHSIFKSDIVDNNLRLAILFSWYIHFVMCRCGWKNANSLQARYSGVCLTEGLLLRGNEEVKLTSSLGPGLINFSEWN